MRLEDCTKAELIKIIDSFVRNDFNGKYRLSRCLSNIKYDRERKKINEAENWGKIAEDARNQYCDFLKKYEGYKLVDIPLDEVLKAEELLKTAEQADKKFLELCNIDKKGKKQNENEA